MEESKVEEWEKKKVLFWVCCGLEFGLRLVLLMTSCSIIRIGLFRVFLTAK